MRRPFRPPIVVLLGPTAAGKTSLSLQWAEELGAEIVGADSVQVYRYMDIGTAKPSRQIREAIPHHVIDVVDPDEPFDAVAYQRMADEAIRQISKRQKHPLVVGGTGLYVRALTHGFFNGPSADPRLRDGLWEKALKEGPASLYRDLKAVDPDAARRIHPNDLFRIIRALEVHNLTGVPISTFHKRHGFSRQRYRAIYLCLYMDRQQLYKRIDQRVEEMLRLGLVEEVKGLLERGYGPDLPPMRSIGYRHITKHLRGECTLKEAVDEMKRDTRHYARRQLTWFKGMKGVRWFTMEQSKSVLEEAGRFLEAAGGLDNTLEGC